MARSVKNNAWNEVFALILLFVGTLLFLALISYTPKDLPSWVWFSHISPPNRPAQNFIGPFGAIIAGFAITADGRGFLFARRDPARVRRAKLFHSSLRVTPRIAWIVLFIASGACLLQLQTQHLQGWKSMLQYSRARADGSVTFLERHCSSTRWAKSARSFCSTGIYVTSLILMTGLRPIHLVRQTVAGIATRLRASCANGGCIGNCANPI